MDYILPNEKVKTIEKEQEFSLNRNYSDKINWKIEIDSKGNTVKISNITYSALINGKWEWVVRYDDHGGTGNFHRHDRISINNDFDTPIYAGVKRKGNKQTLTEWAIKDIRDNYLIYRNKLFKNSGIDLY